MRRRRPKPNYKHIRELEEELGYVEAAPPPPKKRELVSAPHEYNLATVAAKLDPKTGGWLLEKVTPAQFSHMPMFATAFPAYAPPELLHMRPGHRWVVSG